jgi:hypothetical protein
MDLSTTHLLHPIIFLHSGIIYNMTPRTPTLYIPSMPFGERFDLYEDGFFRIGACLNYTKDVKVTLSYLFCG